MKKYTAEEFSKLVGEKVLEKIRKIKLEILNEMVYCIIGIDNKHPVCYGDGYGTSYIINSKTKELYVKEPITSAIMFCTQREYSYERSYKEFLQRHYFHKKSKNPLLFEEDDVNIFDNIIEYIVKCEIASEIMAHADYHKKSPIDKLAFDIAVFPSINMKQFCHVHLDKREYEKLNNFDDILNYISDKVVETINEYSLLINVALNQSFPKEEARIKAASFLRELSKEKVTLESLLGNELLKEDPRVHLALQALEISMSNIHEVVSCLS